MAIDVPETSLVPFAHNPYSASAEIDSTIPRASLFETTIASRTFQRDSTRSVIPDRGSVFDWQILAIGRLTSDLLYDDITPGNARNVLPNIRHMTTLGQGATFTVKDCPRSILTGGGVQKLGAGGVVLKRLRLSHRTRENPEDNNCIAAILFELRVLTHGPLRRHPNIIRFVGLTWEPDVLGRDLLWPILLMERAEFGTLTQFQKRSLTLRYATKKKLCADVGAGLDALHSCGIIHGDVKNENILIFCDAKGGYTAKISDFGCAFLDVNEMDNQLVGMGGTPPWNAPEYRSETLSRSMLKATDVYSYGFLVWRTMLDGRDPFGDFELPQQWDLRLAKIEKWKLQDEMVALASGSIVSQPESDVLTEEVCQVFEMTLQLESSARDLERVLHLLQGGSLEPHIEALGFSRLGGIETEIESMLLEVYKLRDFDNLFQKQYLKALQYSIKYYKEKPTFAEELKRTLLRCYMFGIGGERNPDAAMGLLENICITDYTVILRHPSMVLLAVRFPQILGRPVIENLAMPLNSCLAFNASQGSRYAYIELRARDPVEAANALHKSRTEYCGIGNNIVGEELAEIIGDMEMLSKLINNACADGSKLDDFRPADMGNTLLHCAAMAGYISAVALLVDSHGADVNVMNWLGETPLLQACRSGHFDIVCFLLSHGSDPAIPTAEFSETCLHYLSFFDEDWQIEYLAKDFVSHGLNVDALADAQHINLRFSYEPREWGSPLHRAVGYAHLGAVKALVQLGADPLLEYGDDKGFVRSPILLAVKFHYHAILRFLLFETSALRNLKTSGKLTDLMSTFKVAFVAEPLGGTLIHGPRQIEAYFETFKVLGEAGVIVAGEKTSYELLFAAFKCGSPKIMDFLLKSGCHANASSSGGETLLELSIIACDRQMFKLLLDHGADVSTMCSRGHYLQVCVEHFHHDPFFARELLKRGAATSIPDGDLSTVFRSAVFYGCFDLATLLLEYGADINGTNGVVTVLGEVCMAGADCPLISLYYLLEPPHHYGTASFVVCPANGLTALHVLVAQSEAGRDGSGNLPMLAYLLERFPTGIDTIALVASPLHVAVQYVFIEAVVLLIEAGANVNLLGGPSTALDIALEIAEKADPCATDFPGSTLDGGPDAVEHYIARRWRMVEILVAAGALRSEDLATA